MGKLRIDSTRRTPDRSARACARFSSGISVFFPAFNDALALPALIERTFETLRRVASDFEVIVVNDGSSDDTADVLEQLRQRYAPDLRVVTHPVNQGYGAALRSGFAAATKEYIFYTDGDGQYDPAELENLLLLASPEIGLVNGYKMERSDPWHRIAIGWLYNHFARWLFQIKLRDIDCDFRLIRRDALNLAALQSTGGTICIELVRALELSGAAVVETPVRHYPRKYGRSQFFRIGSLWSTFVQLCTLFISLVALPGLRGWRRTPSETPSQPKPRSIVLAALSAVLLSILAYGRALTLPFISDDYLQIELARTYGPISGWSALANDALYRCRGTSLILTYWLERAVGLSAFYFGIASLVLHAVNSLLVLALGMWRPFGWPVAILAANFFAVNQRHSEAVIWFAAIPELLVFFFVIAGFLCWTRWLESSVPSRFMYLGSLGCFALALLSKESAVSLVPLCALAVYCHPGKRLRKLWGLVPFVALAALYIAAAFAARETHLHFNDGTFSLDAPVFEILLRSVGGLLWFWGFVLLPVLFTRTGVPWLHLLPLIAAWTVITLLPYSFLTYMPRVPSRHTYMAGVGSSWIVAIGLLAVRRYAARTNRMWLVPSMATLIVLSQCGYLWFFKITQYEQRAQPTEALLRIAGENPPEIRAKCFPYSLAIAESALRLHFAESKRPKFVMEDDEDSARASIDFCNVTAMGRRN